MTISFLHVYQGMERKKIIFRKISKRFLVMPLFFLLTGYITVLAQDPAGALNKLALQHQTEKVYIHYDRDFYSAGETIWFKAYLYSNGLPSVLSNNFYLQVLDANGTTIAERKYPVKGATVSGNIILPDSLVQGFYHVRALTPTMLNNTPSFLYRKNIFIYGNPGAPMQMKPTAGSLTIRFFPESGRFVGDVISSLVFKATDSTGNPVDIAGVVKTDDGTMITSFKTTKDGVGRLQFKPQAGKKYIASADWHGQASYHALPEVENAGINLKLENEPGGKAFIINRSKKNKERYDNLFLVAHMNNLIVFEQEIRFDSYFSVKGHLLTDSLPTGIIHFTVFDKEGTPLAERLSFVNNHEFESGGTVEVVKKGTGPREENILSINFPNGAQRSLSVSVIDADVMPQINRESMASALLIRDDMGEVIGSNRYISSNADSSTLDEFDRYLVTQQWKKFSWNEILAGKFPQHGMNDPYLLSFSGQLKDNKTKTIMESGELILFVESEDSVNQEFQLNVSKNGDFRIDSLLVFGNTDFYYAYKNKDGKEKVADMVIYRSDNDNVIDKLPYARRDEEQLSMYKDSLLYVGLAQETVVKQKSASLAEQKELAPVVLESSGAKRPIDIVNEKYTKGAFTAMGKTNIDLVNNPENNRSLSVYDYVKRTIRQLSEQKGVFVNTKFHSLFNSSTSEYDAKQQKSLDSAGMASGGTPPGSVRFVDLGIRERGDYYEIAVFINQTPAGIAQLKTIRIDEIALIKFWDPGFVGAGMNGPGGTLAIYTKNEVAVVNKGMDKLDHIRVNGFSPAGRFAMPNHISARLPDEPADTRRTLLWSPEIFTDENTKTIQLKFYNNDTCKKMRVIVEGFDAKGKLISIIKTIE